MALQIIGFSGSGYIADVDDAFNLKVNLPTTSAGFLATKGPGFATLLSENDPGSFTGVRYFTPPETDDDYRLRVGQDALVFYEPWAGTAINGNAWKLTSTTMQTSMTGGFVRMNSSNVVAVGNVARLETLTTVPSYPSFPLAVQFDLQVNNIGVANNVWEVGLFLSTGATVIVTDGAFIRMNAAGEFRLVFSYAGSETQSAPIDTSGFLPNVFYSCLITISTAEMELWINDVLYAKLDVASAVPGFTQSQALPFAVREYNAALVNTAVQVLVGPVTISIGGMVNALTFRDRVALCEQGAYQTQYNSQAQTANFANSGAPTAATLSNTAAGYTTFGGKFLFAAVAGAETDYCLFGFQVPVEAAAAMNRNLFIRGVRISVGVLGAAIATTPTVLEWGIAVGSIAVTLAQADANTTTSVTKGPRRKALGSNGFTVGTLAGFVDNQIICNFPDTPMVAEPGSFVQVILRIPSGTATGSQTFRGCVDIDGEYE